MKFFNELVLGIIMTVLAMGAVAGAICTFGDPNNTAAGPGAMGAGCAIAFAILLHGMLTTMSDEDNPKKDQADD